MRAHELLLESEKITFPPADEPNTYYGFKVMPYEGNELVSMADSRQRLPLGKGEVHNMAGRGIFIANDPDYVIDYYSNGDPEEVPEMLLKYKFHVNNVTGGSLYDREAEITVKDAVLVNYSRVE